MTSSTTNKDVMLVVSLLISVVSLVLLIGVTWHFRSTLKLLQQQVENDKELLLKLQEQVNVSPYKHTVLSVQRVASAPLSQCTVATNYSLRLCVECVDFVCVCMCGGPCEVI